MATHIVTVAEKKCRNCNGVKATDKFNLYPRNTDGLNSICKDCLIRKAILYLKRGQ
jgi:hypothetical protein